MKKINLFFIAALAIFLFSCGNGKNTQNGDNKDSTSTTSKVEETQGINSYEFVTKISQDKKYLNENLDKTIVLTDLLVREYFYQEISETYLTAHAYNPKDKKMIINKTMNKLYSFLLKGEKIQSNDLGNYDKFTEFKIILKDPKQVKMISFFDASLYSSNVFTENLTYNFKDIIKVKGTVKYDQKAIMLENAEIIK